MAAGEFPATPRAVTRHSGKYRITAVSEQTGVAPATLRAWERRYGIPDPARTDSAYRLYSDHDVALVRRVRELCDNGMSPSDAARLVSVESATRPAAAPAAVRDPYTRAYEEIVEAVEAFDHARLKHAARTGMTLGPATAVTDRVLLPAMREIGQLWHAGKLSVGQEHMATQVLGDTVTLMLGLTERVDADRTIVLAYFADDEHTFPASGLAMHMAAWGYRVVRLGARTPPSAIAHAVQRLSPHLVALSCTLAPPPSRAQELVEAYAAACGDTPWVVGGAGAVQLVELVEARGGTAVVGGEPHRLRATLEGLMSRRAPASVAQRRSRRRR